MKFETLAVHAGARPDPATGSIAPPIHLSTTFEHGPAGETPRGYMYIREGNPTQTRLEEALAALEGGAAALAFGFGPGGGGGVPAGACRPGRTWSIQDDVYYGLRAMAPEFLPALGDGGDAPSTWRISRASRAALRPTTRAHLGRDAVESADEDRGPRGARRDRARAPGALLVGRRHVRDAGAPAAARARRGRRPALDDEVPRRAQRRAGRRARRSGRRDELSAKVEHVRYILGGRGVALQLVARAARAAHARLPDGAALRERAGGRPRARGASRPSRRSTIRGSSRIRATRSRGGR